ncbi:phytanoyl-CoA dioxygenase family protein [Paenibacillus chitinolyticus]|uniref:phytanoyl-CoA dioxygenase family protein n=1 Tax=Paenibacillus chitinolyticus TaxID=79263 RepID=UPI0036D89EB1
MLTTTQVKQFYELGYLILPKIISADLIDRLKQALEQTREKVNQTPTEYNARLITKQGEVSDTWGVNNIFSPQLYDRCYDDIMSEDKILKPIQDLIGKELRFWGAHALWSPQQNDYELYWHRDMVTPEIYEPTGKPNHVQCNIPTFIDNCFHVIPGSHRRPPTEQELTQMKNGESNELPNEVVVTCFPGDVLLMNAWTIHRGVCSFNQIRRTMHFCLQPKNELYGGKASPSWMRDKTYLNSLNDSTRELMRNLINWDDEHPLSHDELIELRRKSKSNREYLTKQSKK